MADLFSMNNRVVLLTGASRGLGRDMALTLAGAGATVLCAGRTVKELEATARSIAKKGGKAHVVPLDITDEAAVREQVETIVRKHRRIDVLVNNAGVIHRENIVDTATADFSWWRARSGGTCWRASTAASSISRRSWRSSAALRWRAMSRPNTG